MIVTFYDQTIFSLKSENKSYKTITTDLGLPIRFIKLRSTPVKNDSKHAVNLIH